MLINFLLATLLIGFSIVLLVVIDRATAMSTSLARAILRLTRRSKLLTEYVLRAYMRYRKAISKPLIHNT